jgi:hypothetical protein
MKIVHTLNIFRRKPGRCAASGVKNRGCSIRVKLQSETSLLLGRDFLNCVRSIPLPIGHLGAKLSIDVCPSGGFRLHASTVSLKLSVVQPTETIRIPAVDADVKPVVKAPSLGHAQDVAAIRKPDLPGFVSHCSPSERQVGDIRLFL